MKQLVVYIYLICFCNLAKGNILTTDSVYANVIFSDLSNGSLYVRIHGGVFSARCDSVISFSSFAGTGFVVVVRRALKFFQPARRESFSVQG